jgi:hypothetical protein
VALASCFSFALKTAMRILSKPSFSTPTFFYINIEYKVDLQIPAELLETAYRDNLQILYSKTNVRLHVAQIRSHSAKLICSSDEDLDDKKQRDIQNFIQETSQRVFSLFEPQIKTPIVVQWEFI